MTERFNLSVRQKIVETWGSDPESKEEKSPLMWEMIHKKVLTPNHQEVQENPRGRSAKLRAALKL